MRDGGGDAETQRRRFATTTRGGECDGGGERGAGEDVENGEHGFRLVERLCVADDFTDDLCFAHLVLELGELLFGFDALLALADGGADAGAGASAGLGQRFDVLGLAEREDVELVVEQKRVVCGAEGEEESLVEACDGVVVGGVGAVAAVHVHAERVELSQAGHGLEEEDDDAAALDGLDGAREHVGRDCLKVLKDEHAVGLAEDLGRVLVVAVADVCEADKELEGIAFALLADAALDVVFDLLLALLAVGGEAEVLLVAPEHVGTRLYARLGEEEVEVDHLVLALVADDDEEGAVVEGDIVADEEKVRACSEGDRRWQRGGARTDDDAGMEDRKYDGAELGSSKSRRVYAQRSFFSSRVRNFLERWTALSSGRSDSREKKSGEEATVKDDAAPLTWLDLSLGGKFFVLARLGLALFETLPLQLTAGLPLVTAADGCPACLCFCDDSFRADSARCYHGRDEADLSASAHVHIDACTRCNKLVFRMHCTARKLRFGLLCFSFFGH
ncbi:hypothetical protein L1887_59470 [Cichorium endivia]|nr:hypothetical protein L1887_59470 [Cichorium endivia]